MFYEIRPTGGCKAASSPVRRVELQRGSESGYFYSCFSPPPPPLPPLYSQTVLEVLPPTHEKQRGVLDKKPQLSLSLPLSQKKIKMFGFISYLE